MYRQSGKSKKYILYTVAGFLALTFIAGGILYTRQSTLQHSLAGKVLRFHVLANSDDKADQELKLKVRDAVGAYLGAKVADARNLSECEQIVDENLAAIVSVAEETVKKEGYDYKVTAERERTSFPSKKYSDYTFPAGEYEALRVVIGAGEGHNWWCVMYPNLCFSGSMYEVTEDEAGEKLREVLTQEEFEQVLSNGNYKIRLKYLTFFNPYIEKLKNAASQ